MWCSNVIFNSILIHNIYIYIYIYIYLVSAASPPKIPLAPENDGKFTYNSVNVGLQDIFVYILPTGV